MTIKIILIIWLCVLAFILYIGYKSAKLKDKNNQIHRDEAKRSKHIYNHEHNL